VSDVYRPLYVMVEAVEAEARRLLEPVPKLTVLDKIERIDREAVERAFRQRFGDNSIHIERNAADCGYRLGHRCKVCRRSHSATITEYEAAAVQAEGPHGFIQLLFDRLNALLEAPCDVELRK
jgi:hypothetical protein